MGLQILALPSGLVPAAHEAAVTYQRNWDKHRRLPMIMFVIVGGDRPIMVDTGPRRRLRPRVLRVRVRAAGKRGAAAAAQTAPGSTRPTSVT
jgi:hypothetical protein